jgi:hypothetical protein
MRSLAPQSYGSALFGFTDFFDDERIRAISSYDWHLIALVRALVNFYSRR